MDQAVLLRLEKSISDHKKLDNLLPLMAGTQSDDVIRGLIEQIEKLEQLRVLEAGHAILVGVTDDPSIGVDTPEDAAKFEAWLG